MDATTYFNVTIPFGWRERVKKALQANTGICFEIVRGDFADGSVDWVWTVEASADERSAERIQFVLWDEVGLPWSRVKRLTREQIEAME